MNFIELVNGAIDESGATLTPLDSLDFANPSDPMQRRFKNWTARAWKELQLSRERWTFMSKRGFGIIRPRIYVKNGSLLTAPVPGDMFEGRINGCTFTVVKVTLLSGDWTLGTAEAFIDIDNIVGEYGLGETFDLVTGVGQAAFIIGGRARWDFSEFAPDLDDLDYQSVYLGYVDSTPAEYMDGLTFVEWNLWNNYFEADVGNLSKPAQITETPDRLTDLYPSPEKPYRIYFNYERGPQQLVNEDDIPDLPEEFHDLIMWGAVKHYAEFDENATLAGRAAREARKYRVRLENKCLPKLGWAPSPFNRG